MPGQGKYTVYAPESNAKNTLLAKLFPTSPTSNFIGNEQGYRDVVVTSGNQYLTVVDQKGDPYFGAFVELNYPRSPDILAGADGDWKNAGDPANSFAPDVSSPGPGKTDGSDKSEDPKIKASDLKPSYVPGGPKTSTRSPAEYAKKIAALKLGVSPKMGSSDSSSG
jgi:hypothetical protein